MVKLGRVKVGQTSRDSFIVRVRYSDDVGGDDRQTYQTDYVICGIMLFYPPRRKPLRILGAADVWWISNSSVLLEI